MTGEPLDPTAPEPAGPAPRAAAGADLLVDLATRVRLPDPPLALVRSLDDLFEVWAQARRAPSLRRRVVAALAGGTTGALAPGWRGGAAEARQLVFATDLAEVALDVQSGPDGGTIDGQLFAAAGALPDGTVVEVRSAAGSLGACPVDEAGSFVLTEVPAGVYELVVVTPDADLVLSPVEVDAAP